MNFVAPVMIVLAVVLPAMLAGKGIRLRHLAIAIGAVFVVGVYMFKTSFDASSLEMQSTGQPGVTGFIGILIVISALVAGITTAIIGIVHAMSGKSKG